MSMCELISISVGTMMIDAVAILSVLTNLNDYWLCLCASMTDCVPDHGRIEII